MQTRQLHCCFIDCQSSASVAGSCLWSGEENSKIPAMKLIGFHVFQPGFEVSDMKSNLHSF